MKSICNFFCPQVELAVHGVNESEIAAQMASAAATAVYQSRFEKGDYHLYELFELD